MARNRNMLFLILFGGAFFITFCIIVIYLFASFFIDKEISLGDAIAVVDVTGEIFYDRSKIKEIKNYGDNDRVKAVLVHINSPGGGVAASQELYHTIRQLGQIKPVVACMGEIAASGGYYVACGADSIVANEGTITGSIGVIATFMRTEELYHKIGLDVTVVKAGKYKDIGSPYRKMSEEEKQYIGSLLEVVYQQFLRAVSESRGIPVEEVNKVAEGRLFSGEEAVEKGLIDRIGTFEDALQMAARMGGIDGEPRVIKKKKRRTLLERLLGIKSEGLPLVGERQRLGLKYIVP